MNTILYLMLLLPVQASDSTTTNDQQVELIRDDNSVEVRIDNKIFTRYDFSSYSKPILYPVYAPDQIPMSRNYPMKKLEGESDDHPHHKSIWLGHEISDVDFWTEKGGKVVLESLQVDPKSSSIKAKHKWIDKKSGDTVVEDKTTVRFAGDSNHRIIDFQIQFIANSQDVVFHDTKEGFFAIRVHPALRTSPDSKRGVRDVTGTMVNSSGNSGKGIWGKEAQWVCYYGVVDGKKCGVAMFDHPKNLRHPTTWHARDYGLLAANPFGLSYFKKGDHKSNGKYVLPKGKTINFRYGLLFFSGEFDADSIARYYREFANGK